VAGFEMIVEKRRIGEHTILAVEGVVKLGESAEFLAETLERALEDGAGNVLLDLEKINYIDSTGVGELVGYLGRFQERRRRLVLVHPSERIRRLLEIAQLDDLFPTYPDLGAAVAAECG
jgi:anti-sigma B factor antagonist